MGLGVKGFLTKLSAYQKDLQATKKSLMISDPENFVEVDVKGTVAELNLGDWEANNIDGVRHRMSTSLIACSHPIFPFRRLRNIDTGEIKVELAFMRSNRYMTYIADFDTIANARNIVKLSNIGVSVSSGERSQNLVDYLRDTMDLNYDRIQEVKSVSRLGWTGEGFSPYVEGLAYDGNVGFENVFKAVHSKGDYDEWLKEAIKCRKYSTTARLVLAASFASVLIEPLGINPFFLHLWGSDSGTGKTVAQMLAVSVWGVPTVPGSPLLPSFKATTVGLEVRAGFLNSLPLVLDELQLAKDNKGKIIFNVYELASGQGKTRSNKNLGVAAVPTWRNVFITSGETPLVSESDGAGAQGRVIEVECKSAKKVIENGHATANVLNSNYGFAGRDFVEKLSNADVIEEAKKLYDEFFVACSNDKAAEKQAMAAAVLLIADKFSTEWIFKDGEPLKVGDITEFLKSVESSSMVNRGYSYMCDWVSSNSARFKIDGNNGELYGKTDGECAYIISSVFNRACEAAGFNSKALLSGLKSKGLIKCRADGKCYTAPQRIGGTVSNCVCLILPNLGEGERELLEEYPF